MKDSVTLLFHNLAAKRLPEVEPVDKQLLYNPFAGPLQEDRSKRFRESHPVKTCTDYFAQRADACEQSKLPLLPPLPFPRDHEGKGPEKKPATLRCTTLVTRWSGLQDDFPLDVYFVLSKLLRWS